MVSLSVNLTSSSTTSTTTTTHIYASVFHVMSRPRFTCYEGGSDERQEPIIKSIGP